MKTAYPAILHKEDSSFWVEFPDLGGCFSDGNTMADAISNAADALGGYLCSLMDRNIDVPRASDAKEIDPERGTVTIIVADPLSYKRSTESPGCNCL